MLCTVGNEDLTVSAKRDADAVSNAAEYDLSHILSSPIEPGTAPVLLDREKIHDGVLHDY